MLQDYTYPVTELILEMCGQMVGAIERAVLSAGAAECHHQVAESALQISAYGGIYQPVYVIKILLDLTLGLQELNHGRIGPGYLLVLVILAGIMHGAAVWLR